MEMRAKEDISVGKDTTLPILPLAFSLSDSFLHSHCSNCFHPLLHNTPNNAINTNHVPQPQPPFHLSCNPSHCNASIRYCSKQCSDADSHRHVSSGECHLFLSLQSAPDTWHLEDISDLRVALRLLLSLDGTPSPIQGRIAGLLTNREKLESDPDILERIRVGAKLMAFARMRLGVRGNAQEEEEEEAAALCLVLTNAVEVQVNEGRAIGTAVYGPRFSWLNHSCLPNACYRFALTGSGDSDSETKSDLLISARSSEKSTLETWNCTETKLNYKKCGVDGPRVVVRSIKPIKKGEEVCIAYTDLLQPTATRRSDLWSKYRFVCCCERCCASPPMYVDWILEGKADEFHALNDDAFGKINDCLNQGIEYVSSGNPKACCERLEIMLAEGFCNFKLHPLHQLSLNAYMILASGYSICAANDNQWEKFVPSRAAAAAAAAHSILLAGVTHHLYSSGSSLIASVAHFWINAGKHSLALVRSRSELSSLLRWRSGGCLLLKKFEMEFVLGHSQTQTEGFGSWDELVETSKGFLNCAMRISPKVWPFLICGLDHLKCIKDPIDFGWLRGKESVQPVEEGAKDVLRNEGSCCEYTSLAEIHGEVEGMVNLFELAAHCLLFGEYLSNICYGPHGYLSIFARELMLHLIECHLDSKDVLDNA